MKGSLHSCRQGKIQANDKENTGACLSNHFFAHNVDISSPLVNLPVILSILEDIKCVAKDEVQFAAFYLMSIICERFFLVTLIALEKSFISEPIKPLKVLHLTLHIFILMQSCSKISFYLFYAT